MKMTRFMNVSCRIPITNRDDPLDDQFGTIAKESSPSRNAKTGIVMCFREHSRNHEIRQVLCAVQGSERADAVVSE